MNLREYRIEYETSPPVRAIGHKTFYAYSKQEAREQFGKLFGSLGWKILYVETIL
jgi:hypothetical protein